MLELMGQAVFSFFEDAWIKDNSSKPLTFAKLCEFVKGKLEKDNTLSKKVFRHLLKKDEEKEEDLKTNQDLRDYILGKLEGEHMLGIIDMEWYQLKKREWHQQFFRMVKGYEAQGYEKAMAAYDNVAQKYFLGPPQTKQPQQLPPKQEETEQVEEQQDIQTVE